MLSKLCKDTNVSMAQVNYTSSTNAY